MILSSALRVLPCCRFGKDCGLTSRYVIRMHIPSREKILKALFQLSADTRVVESSSLSVKESPMSKLAIMSFLSTPQSAENANSARLDITNLQGLTTRVERPICVAKSAIPKEKVKCPMEPPVSVLAAKISSTTWELPPFLNTPVLFSRSISDF